MENSLRVHQLNFCYIIFLIYLAVFGLSCSTWDLPLQHMDSLAVAHRLQSAQAQ